MQAGDLQFHPKYASLQVIFTVFDQICTVVIYKEFLKFYEPLLPRKHLVAANRLKVLKIFISMKVTVYMQDRRLSLRKPKMPRVLSGNPVVLKWQNIHVISNIRYTTIYSKTWTSSLLYIQQRRI